ncbi:MAG TPA: hypothetical protein VLX92_16290, partial [Kofleriaceae bacterium]|nr:hypothetical protein [Kofleriaceae bacterium]
AAGWVALRREVCTTGAEQRVAPERLAARSACLDARLAELAQTAQRIVGDRAADALAQWRRIEAMAPVEACRDDATAQLAVGDAVHQELMRAIQSIDPVRATVAELEPLRARAEAAGDRAAELVAELELGELLAGSDPKQGDAMLAQALAHAEQLGVESARLRALAALARSACRQGRYDAAAPLFALADAAAPRDPSDADAVERAHAECLYQQRSPDAVPRLRALIERSVARAGAENPDVLALHLELAQALYALGRVDEGAREQATFDRILARYVAASGTAAQREEAAASAARDRGDLDGAIDHQRRAVELWGPDHAKERAFALSDLAILYDIAASWQLAAATYGEVAHGIAADAPSDLRVLRAESLVSRGTVLLALGDLDGATAAFDQGAPEAHELADTAVTIEADLGRGRIAVARGDGARGARLLRAALAAYAAQPQPAAYRTGVAQLALARALWAAGDRAGAIATAQLAETSIARALDDARASSLGRHQVPVREAALAEVAAWRDAHRPGPR